MKFFRDLLSLENVFQCDDNKIFNAWLTLEVMIR
jgi:hypothetical protein